MFHRLVPCALAAASVLLISAAPDRSLNGVRLAQVTVRERIIIRIPRMPPPPPDKAARRASATAAPRWVEKKGPACVVAAQLAGALVNGQDVDLVLRGGDHVRAKLDGDCPALDFYGGFYVRPSADGQVCAGRDVIRVRSGDSCTISRFRTLVQKR